MLTIGIPHIAQNVDSGRSPLSAKWLLEKNISAQRHVVHMFVILFSSPTQS